jgi:hypothetical protein
MQVLVDFWSAIPTPTSKDSVTGFSDFGAFHPQTFLGPHRHAHIFVELFAILNNLVLYSASGSQVKRLPSDEYSEEFSQFWNFKHSVMK